MPPRRLRIYDILYFSVIKNVVSDFNLTHTSTQVSFPPAFITRIVNTSQLRVIKFKLNRDLSLIPDLTGKVALVTSTAGTKSIGFQTAHQLALKGVKVYIGARTAEKAEIAINDIRSASPFVPKQLLKTFVAELGDLKDARLLATDPQCCQVGSPNRLELDSNRISLSTIVNHLSPFVITKTLLPLLKSTTAYSSDVRVVTLSSYALIYVPGPVKLNAKELSNDFGGGDDMHPSILRYALSKLANMLFAYQLQKKLDADRVDIISISLHPGAVRTAASIDLASRSNSGHLVDLLVSH
ncbi:hypothetical protein BDQ17DRAFT_1330895 [Cyathus striatus]|nr:hypothetical protein BDQ17DRAFT_1330895 [Cyathus striatus]